jgi:hypothetical protein
MVLVFLQNDPGGQGLSKTDPAGQKLPVLQRNLDAGEGQ